MMHYFAYLSIAYQNHNKVINLHYRNSKRFYPRVEVRWILKVKVEDIFRYLTKRPVPNYLSS